MSLKIGIVGLPNVGKSTLFNALTQAQNAEAANYPFCTIEPNQAVVTVPDVRVDRLVEMVGAQKPVYATIEFVDIAGLIEGASRNEGLGNQFLGHIRDVDALLHVVRCFDDENVMHIRDLPDPRADIEIIHTELALADMQQLERKLEKLERQVKGDAKLRPVQALAQELHDYLATGQPLWEWDGKESEHFIVLNQEMRFLTAKPVLFVGNVDEETLSDPDSNDYLKEAQAVAQEHGSQVVMLCARLEAEMIDLPKAEQEEYLQLLGIQSTGLDKVIQASYRLLGLISYFTFNEKEVRAWTIPDGSTAPQAAGVIHTDFERGFIRAEVVPYAVFEQYGDRQQLRDAGLMQQEGKTYIVQDGDLIHFRFNV